MQDSYLRLNLAPYIDHALLDPGAGPAEVDIACRQTEHHRFACLCVYPWAVTQAVEFLRPKNIPVCAVIGFPSGGSASQTKLFEAQLAAEQGATELDAVINLGLLKAGQTEAVYAEMAQIVEETGLTVKAILEMGRLTQAETQLAAEICLDAGVSFLKTHTGWFGGAAPADVKFLAQLTQGRVGVKAAGGIRALEQAAALIEAGATRLGTSRGVDLLRQQQELD
ncbi:MAG: deoxyribose-phosphate aldolase [Cyanobacteria bacterium RI_101]|nr:deoxyribose-phosphate aldolase [Cyanobacteria bacterium RI_101]